MKQRYLSSILLLSLSASLAAQATEHDLRIHTQKGASVWLVQHAKMDQAIDMGMQQMDMGNTTTYSMQLTVKEVDEKGGLVVEAKLARIAGMMNLPMLGEVEFDSINRKPGAAPAAEEDGFDGGMGMPNMDAVGAAMEGLAGSTFVARVSAYGKVESIEGVKKTLDAARQKAGPMGAQMLGAQLNEKNIEKLIGSAFGTLPEKAIAVGASWDRNDAGGSARAQVTNKTKLTLAKFGEESFEISIAGTVEKDAGDATDLEGDEDESEEAATAKEMMAGMSIKNGKISGTTKVSRNDSFVIESTSVMTMDMILPSPMGGEMSIKQKVTTMTKRTTEADAMKKPGAAKADANKGAGK